MKKNPKLLHVLKWLCGSHVKQIYMLQKLKFAVFKVHVHA